MRISSLPCLGSVALTSLLVGAPSLPAGVAIDPLAVEASVRKADADWAAAASSHSVDAWMSFYAADAIVLLPDDQLASGRELVRQTVTRLLERPHLSVASRPIDVQVARSGDVASLVGAYELRFDLHGSSTSSRGRRLEIWRKQADGTWKCIVDGWTLDQPPGGAPAAAPVSAPAGSPPGEPVALAEPAAQPPPAVLPPSSPTQATDIGPPSPKSEAATKYGDMPTNYEQAIRKYFLEHLKHPETVQYGEITRPEQGFITKLGGGLLMTEKRVYGWTVKAPINAQDSRGSYVGFKTYSFLFRGEKIVDARVRLPGEN